MSDAQTQQDRIHPGPGELDKLIIDAYVESLRDEIRDWDKAYDALMQSNSELRGRLRWATRLMERFRDCRKYGVGMPQLPGSRIYLDDEVDNFLDKASEYPRRPECTAVDALRAIAAQDSEDPVLSNLIHGIRYGLKLAEENANNSPLHPTQMD